MELSFLTRRARSWDVSRKWHSPVDAVITAFLLFVAVTCLSFLLSLTLYHTLSSLLHSLRITRYPPCSTLSHVILPAPLSSVVQRVLVSLYCVLFSISDHIHCHPPPPVLHPPHPTRTALIYSCITTGLDTVYWHNIYDTLWLPSLELLLQWRGEPLSYCGDCRALATDMEAYGGRGADCRRKSALATDMEGGGGNCSGKIASTKCI